MMAINKDFFTDNYLQKLRLVSREPSSVIAGVITITQSLCWALLPRHLVSYTVVFVCQAGLGRYRFRDMEPRKAVIAEIRIPAHFCFRSQYQLAYLPRVEFASIFAIVARS